MVKRIKLDWVKKKYGKKRNLNEWERDREMGQFLGVMKEIKPARWGNKSECGKGTGGCFPVLILQCRKKKLSMLRQNGAKATVLEKQQLPTSL